jgi:hypothetical protein
MTSVYAAHIVSPDAGLGDAEIVVMTQDEGMGADPLIHYPWPASAARVPVTLYSNGWTIAGEPTEVQPGYSIVDVQAGDWPVIVKAVTVARAAALAEAARAETAWRTLLADAMGDRRTDKTAIAETAGVSRARAYQIKDGK